jgi:hypothetical protein
LVDWVFGDDHGSEVLGIINKALHPGSWCPAFHKNIELLTYKKIIGALRTSWKGGGT